MERKTKVNAEPSKHDIIITREFELPLELLFKAYTEPEIIEQWMGNKVLKHESKKHGSYQFETRDAKGNVLFKANGVIHDFVENEKIVRTFEMENMPFPAQLEFLEFEKTGADSSKLQIQMVFKSVADRDQMLKLPFANGINMAHNRLQEIAKNLK